MSPRYQAATMSSMGACEILQQARSNTREILGRLRLRWAAVQAHRVHPSMSAWQGPQHPPAAR